MSTLFIDLVSGHRAIFPIFALKNENPFMHRRHLRGADPGFVLGGGAPLRNGVNE